MRSKRRYQGALAMRQICSFLEIPEERVLARMGRAGSVEQRQRQGIDAQDFFEGWSAMEAEAGIPDMPLRLGKSFACGPLTPSLFAFSCSPDVETGLRRLATFKPLVAPIGLGVERSRAGLIFTVASSEPEALMPASMVAFEFVFLTECVRIFTGQDVRPREVILPEGLGPTAPYAEFFGVTPGTGSARVLLTPEDAALPLVSEDTEFWQIIEKELTGRLRKLERSEGLAAQVRDILVETLPSGQISVELVCRRLGISRRSLQRGLQAEGATFQALLNETRADLAQTYLRRGDMSTEEISHLLAFRDPNSFYRAFQSWTGMTPSEARSRALH